MQVKNKQQQFVTTILSWKKEVIVRLFLLIIKLISSPQTMTGTGITMIIMSCNVMQKLFIPQRLMASGYFY